MDPSRALFAVIGATGTLAAACALIGEHRWRRRFVDLRALMLMVALLWLPATIDLIVQQEVMRAQDVGAWVGEWWVETFIPTTTTTTTP